VFLGKKDEGERWQGSLLTFDERVLDFSFYAREDALQLVILYETSPIPTLSLLSLEEVAFISIDLKSNESVFEWIQREENTLKKV